MKRHCGKRKGNTTKMMLRGVASDGISGVGGGGGIDYSDGRDSVLRQPHRQQDSSSTATGAIDRQVIQQKQLHRHNPNERGEQQTRKKIQLAGPALAPPSPSFARDGGGGGGSRGFVAIPSGNNNNSTNRYQHRYDPSPLLPGDSISMATNETEQTHLGAHYVYEGIGEQGQDQERQASDADTFAGNTTLVEAEPVLESVDDGYERLEHRVEEEVLRRLQVPATTGASSNDENNGTYNDNTFRDGGTSTSQPVLATVLETEEGSNNNVKDGNGQGERSRRAKLLIITAAIGVIGVVILVVITFLIINSNDNNSGSNTRTTDSVITSTAPTVPPPTMKSPTTAPATTEPPTAPPITTLSPTSQPTTLIHVIADILGIEDVFSLPTSTAQYEALEWITYQDPLLDDLLRFTTDTPTNDSSSSLNRYLSERYAVVVLYFATDGINAWDDQLNFLSGTSICNWNNGLPFDDPSDKGIYCNDQNLIIKIDVGGNGLEGTIPPQLSELISITELWFNFNDLEGTIPDSLHALTRLNQVSFAWNNLSGTIPSSFGTSWVRLSDIYLSRNSLTGPIPSTFGSLLLLEELYVNDNQLSGSISSSLSSLVRLQEFLAYNNQLTGTIPESFTLSTLTSLTSLSLQENLLTGNVSPNFCSSIDPTRTPLTTLRSDCAADPTPEIICTCCTRCF